MREIFFEEKLGETRKNSEGCEPHGQRWGGSSTGGDGFLGKKLGGFGGREWWEQ